MTLEQPHLFRKLPSLIYGNLHGDTLPKLCRRRMQISQHDALCVAGNDSKIGGQIIVSDK